MPKYNKFKKFFFDLAQIYWTTWSNFRFRKTERHSTALDSSHKVETLEDIINLVRDLYKKFKYTQDGIDQLFDAIVPPPEAYRRASSGELKDDCDGFHSLVYNCLTLSGIHCYILVTHAKKAGHCTLVFKLNDRWYAVDYNDVFASTDKLASTIDEFNAYFKDHYSNGNPVDYNALITYNYDSGKFKFLNITKGFKKEDK